MNPQVTVIVPHHLNQNDSYLHWCLYSISQSVNIDLEIICISDAEKEPEIQVPGTILLVHDRQLSNVTKKWHHGVKIASPKSKYIMLISDDVMVSKWTIGEMAQTIGDHKIILSPASNCDATTRYHAQFQLFKYRPYHGTGIPELTHPTPEAITLGLKSTLEDIKGFEQQVIDFPRERKILLNPGWVSFYCTMFPKSVIESVGGFDEKLDVRGNDVDYCHRAAKLGIPSLIHLGVFALHFGDRTLPHCTTKEEYDSADRAMLEKYYPGGELRVPEEHGDLL